jgi:predicted KAP-like P-loop ATPase
VGLGQGNNEKAKKIFLSIAKKLLSSGPLITATAGAMGLPFAGSAAKSAMELAANAIGESIKIDKTVEGEFKALSKEMQFHKILYLIDDIDRLTPDQALLVFRLVKSVGRLPNVV